MMIAIPGDPPSGCRWRDVKNCSRQFIMIAIGIF
jgi:hypothetical protein